MCEHQDTVSMPAEEGCFRSSFLIIYLWAPSRGELRTQTPDTDKFVTIVMLLSYYIGGKKSISNCVKNIPS